MATLVHLSHGSGVIDQEAFELGRQAFAAGIVRIPAHDAALINMMVEGQAFNRLDSWLRGWDSANLESPVE